MQKFKLEAKHYPPSGFFGAESDAAALDFAEVAALFAFSAPLERAGDPLKTRLLAAITPQNQQIAPGMYASRGKDSVWIDTPYPGVSYKKLLADPVC